METAKNTKTFGIISRHEKIILYTIHVFNYYNLSRANVSLKKTGYHLKNTLINEDDLLNEYNQNYN